MVAMAAVLASIPSPPTGVYHVGPLTLHMYGVMLLLAIAAAVWLTGKRWVRFGGEWDLVYRVTIYGVIAGIVGARLYHDLTSWNQDQAIHDHWYGPLAVWQGGLGIWGGIAFGAFAGAWVVRRSGNSARLFMDAAAPALLLAQAIGRWGNYWNQELYGGHTTLPWALEIHGKAAANLYHPTFLYESLWDLIGVVLLLWIPLRQRPGSARSRLHRHSRTGWPWFRARPHRSAERSFRANRRRDARRPLHRVRRARSLQPHRPRSMRSMRTVPHRVTRWRTVDCSARRR